MDASEDNDRASLASRYTAAKRDLDGISPLPTPLLVPPEPESPVELDVSKVDPGRERNVDRGEWEPSMTGWQPVSASAADRNPTAALAVDNDSAQKKPRKPRPRTRPRFCRRSRRTTSRSWRSLQANIRIRRFKCRPCRV